MKNSENLKDLKISQFKIGYNLSVHYERVEKAVLTLRKDSFLNFLHQ